MKSVDCVELAMPCGARLTLLVMVDRRRCRCGRADCLAADTVARCILREWHREELEPATERGPGRARGEHDA